MSDHVNIFLPKTKVSEKRNNNLVHTKVGGPFQKKIAKIILRETKILTKIYMVYTSKYCADFLISVTYAIFLLFFSFCLT